MAAAPLLTRLENEFGWAELAGAEPHPLLRAHVIRYAGYAMRMSFGRSREVPTARIPMIINLGSPLRLEYPHAAARSASYAHGFVGGMSDAPVIVDSGGEQHGMQVDLTPVGASMFLGRPLAELTNAVVGLQDVFGRRAVQVVERLRDEPHWPTRFRMLDVLLGSRLAAAPEVPPDLVWAWRRLSESTGALGIGALATELGCSRKHLSRRFGTHFGLPPKTVGRILRFDAVMAELRPGRPVSLAEMANRLGYYDQAHLNRDFRQFAGITPSELLARTADGMGVAAD